MLPTKNLIFTLKIKTAVKINVKISQLFKNVFHLIEGYLSYNEWHLNFISAFHGVTYVTVYH